MRVDKKYREVGSIIIPNSVTKIGGLAFTGVIGLKSITLPSSLKTVGSNLFSGSTSLTTLNIPSDMKLSTWPSSSSFMGGADGAYRHYISTINTNGNPYIFVDGGAIYQKHTSSGEVRLIGVLDKVTEVTCIDSCKFICGRSFEASDVVTLNTNKVERIEALGFYSAPNLKNVEMPNVKYIGGRAFENSGVSNIYLPKIETLGTTTGENGGALSFSRGTIKLGEKISSIGSNVFCSHLTINNYTTSIDLSECVLLKTIGYNVFVKQSYLTSLILPPNLEVIKEGAFRKISKEFTMEIPESVTTIEAGSFVDCPKMKLKAPSHLKSQNSSGRWGIPNSRITWY